MSNCTSPCNTCNGNCCELRIHLNSDDKDRIKTTLDLTDDEFSRILYKGKYLAKRESDKLCIFHNKDNPTHACMIHDIKPKVCKDYDEYSCIRKVNINESSTITSSKVIKEG